MLTSAIISYGRSLANVPNTSFYTATDALLAANASYKELYELMCENSDDYFVTQLNFNQSTLTPDTETNNLYTYSLPSDFFRLRLLQRKVSTYWETMEKLTLENYGTGVNGSGYRFFKDKIKIFDLNAGTDYQLWYYPNPVELTTSPDYDLVYPSTLVNQIISYQIAVEIRRKQSLDTSSFEQRKIELISQMFKQLTRDNNGFERVRNIFNDGGSYFV